MQVKEDLCVSITNSYLKEYTDGESKTHLLYFINKNVLLSKNMLKEMVKYNYVEFGIYLGVLQDNSYPIIMHFWYYKNIDFFHKKHKNKV